jgi:hypothetical protein
MKLGLAISRDNQGDRCVRRIVISPALPNLTKPIAPLTPDQKRAIEQMVIVVDDPALEAPFVNAVCNTNSSKQPLANWMSHR